MSWSHHFAATRRSGYRVVGPTEMSEPSTNGSRWLINGFPATVQIWTEEQWAALSDRPSNAQYHPFGVWCALRLE